MIFRFSRLIRHNMSILHIAEKNSIAKQVSNILSRANKRVVIGCSKYNPIFQFNLQQRQHSFTSVRGHIFNYQLPQQWKNWKALDNRKILLSQVPMIKKLGPDMNEVVKNLQILARKSQQIILWLDCDREGQAIAFEVIEICTRVNPRLRIKRAKFSAVTAADVWNAYNGLIQPNKLEADAVNYRIQIDFRTGCAFTRYQTVVFQRYFQMENGSFLSYGPCQMPTLCFVVDRYLEIKNFKPEKFWFIEMIYVINQNTGITFTWQKKNTRNQVEANQIMYKILNSFPNGKVMARTRQRNKNQKKRYRPFPLTTVKFQKLATDKLRISSAKAMQIAQKLYQRGLISYPRTQTNAFPKTMNLKALVERLQGSSQYGNYVHKLLQQNKFTAPKAGNSNDQAHTPIHPVKLVQKDQLTNQQWRVYDLIVRSFLACCSADAIGQQFQVKAEINNQMFKASYLTIKQLNYLQIYPFQKWVQTSFPAEIPDQFPVMVTLKDSKTTPPGYLTESELIDLMQKNQIGTDSTIHEHIQTIQKRHYAVKTNNTFKPTNLGASIVQTYKQLQIALPQCQIRRRIEQKMNNIAQGQIQKQAATQQTLHQMIPIYDKLQGIKQQWLETIKKYMQSNSDLKKIQVQQRTQQQQQNQSKKFQILACKCLKCGQNDAFVRYSQKNQSYFIGCSKFPNCRWTQSLPSYIELIKQTNKQCNKCQIGRIVQIKAKEGKIIDPLMMRIKFQESQTGWVQVCLTPKCDGDFYEFVDQFTSFNNNSNTNMNAQRSNYTNNQRSNYNSNRQRTQNDQQNSNSNSRNYRSNTNNYSGAGNSNYTNKFKNNSTQNTHPSTKKTKNASWSASKSNEQMKQYRCYRCNQMGHIAPNCPQKNAGGSSYSGSTNKYNDFKSGFPQEKKKYNRQKTQQSQSQQLGKKVCKECGVQGRHPKGSNCPAVQRRKKKD